jgi:hypothetical protein
MVELAIFSFGFVWIKKGLWTSLTGLRQIADLLLDIFFRSFGRLLSLFLGFLLLIYTTSDCS